MKIFNRIKSVFSSKTQTFMIRDPKVEDLEWINSYLSILSTEVKAVTPKNSSRKEVVIAYTTSNAEVKTLFLLMFGERLLK